MEAKSKNVVFFVVMLLLMLTIVEGLSFAAGKVLQRYWAMWRPPDEDRGKASISYDEYLMRRDAVLGWPSPSEYGKNLDVNGAHRSSLFPNGPTQGACISLYGDSFTQGGGDVSSPDKVWGQVLSGRLGCYVANFGMGGYGTDQAYLRFEGNHSDSSKVVIFGIHTENVKRNLTRIRDLIAYGKGYTLKPRFVLNGQNQLELVPLPRLTEQEYRRVVGLSDPLLLLPHENFQAGGPAGAVGLDFPYTVSVARNLLFFYGFHSRLFREPEWIYFMEKGHPLRGLEITVGITRKFVELAKERGKRPLVVILPHPQDFKYFQARGRWPYQNLIDEFGSASIPFVDFGPYLLFAAQGRSLEAYFGRTGHYSDQGNALVAQFMHTALTEKALVPDR